MVIACVFSILTLGDGAVIINATLVGTGVSAIGGSDALTLFDSDICTTLGVAPDLLRRT